MLESYSVVKLFLVAENCSEGLGENRLINLVIEKAICAIF